MNQNNMVDVLPTPENVDLPEVKAGPDVEGFTKEYEALCAKYKLRVVPQTQLVLQEIV